MTLNILTAFGFIFLAGLLSAKATKLVKLPSITGYLALGIIIGPSILNILPIKIVESSGFISKFVLGMVAFGIGRNFQKQNFRVFGRSVLWISTLEALGAWFFVTLVLIILRQPLYIAILFGSIASATAPAATVMVIREYRSRGPLTNVLLGVVAIDDAWCLIIFASSLALSKSLYHHMANQYMLIGVIVRSLVEIAGSFILGLALGIVLHFFSKILKSAEEILTVSIGFIFIATGIAEYFHLSTLLSCMAMGAVFVNIKNSNKQFFESMHTIDTALFLLFFVLAGSSLEIAVLDKLGIIGLFYLIFRVVGKVTGSYIGGRISNSSSTIKKYLGWGLIPQAGVALGCALVVKAEFPEAGKIVFNTIVATTVIYEIFGPICTKYALSKAGELNIPLKQD